MKTKLKPLSNRIVVRRTVPNTVANGNTIATDNGTVNFQPMHDRILVKRIPDVQSSIIYIPDIARENSKRAEVISVGKKVRDLKPGDLVLVPGAAAKYPDWEKNDYMLITEADIGGILETVND